MGVPRAIRTLRVHAQPRASHYAAVLQLQPSRAAHWLGICASADDRRRGAPSSSLPRSQLGGLQADQEVHQHVQDAPCGMNNPRRQPTLPSPASSRSTIVRGRCLFSMPCRSALPRSRPPYASPRLSHMHAAVPFSALTAARLGIMIKGCRQRGVSVQGFTWCRKKTWGKQRMAVPLGISAAHARAGCRPTYARASFAAARCDARRAGSCDRGSGPKS